MRRLDRECRHARRDLARQAELNVVDQKRLDVHLNLCADCRQVAEDFALITAGPGPIETVTENNQRRLYNQIAPAIYEIADSTKKPERPRWGRWVFVVAVSAASIAVGLALFFSPAPVPTVEGKLAGRIPIAIPDNIIEEGISFHGLIDRCEGEVLVDGNSSGDKRDITIRKDTRIVLDDGSRFTFHVGDLTRIALFGEAAWHLTASTETYLEMQLDRGRLVVDFDADSGRVLKVVTPDSIVQVTGTLFTVEVHPGEMTQVGVLHGSVEVVPRHGSAQMVAVSEGELTTMPGDPQIVPLSDHQRMMAAEIQMMSEYSDENTRTVRFDGSPERVKVEVDGRVLGITPLTMRLPEGPVSYTLTAPGMEPYVGVLAGEPEEEVAFSMRPAIDYEPTVHRPITAPRAKKRARRHRRHRAAEADPGWDLFKRARAAMTAGDIPFAIRLLEQVVEESSGANFDSALALLAECYAAIGEYRKAADSFDRIIAMDPDSATAQNARYEVGRLAMDRLNNLKRAHKAFTAYVESPRGGALKEEAYYSLCELDSRKGALHSAARCFDSFLKSFPNAHRAPDARLHRGAFYQELENRWSAAERDLMAFIKAKPRHPRAEEARYRVVLGRYQMRDERGALRMIDNYLSKHPKGQYRLRVRRIRQAILNPNFSWKNDAK